MEKLFFLNEDGLTLCGLLSAPAANERITILCHGIRGDKTEVGAFDRLEQVLNNAGENTFRFDFRAQGESEGLDKDLTVSGEIRDLKAAVTFLKTKGFRCFHLLGASFGASICALSAADLLPDLDSLILWYGALDYTYISNGNLFSDENMEIAERDGFCLTYSIESGKPFRFGRELFREIHHYRPYEALADLKLPILLVHGTEDALIPYRLSEYVNSRCRNSQLALIPGGTHSFVDCPEALNQAAAETLSFIRRHFSL